MAHHNRRTDIDLVAVLWGDTQGVVSLKRRQWLFYTIGPVSGHHVNTDTGLVVCADIDDADFELLGRGRVKACSWDDVVALLTHPRFPLRRRIEGR